MKHFATPRFWACYRTLPAGVQKLADEKYDLLKSDPQHPSLNVKKVGRIFSVRIGLHYGEVEMRGEQVTGLAVHAAARVMGQAGADRIVLSGDAAEALGGSVPLRELG